MLRDVGKIFADNQDAKRAVMEKLEYVHPRRGLLNMSGLTDKDVCAMDAFWTGKCTFEPLVGWESPKDVKSLVAMLFTVLVYIFCGRKKKGETFTFLGTFTDMKSDGGDLSPNIFYNALGGKYNVMLLFNVLLVEQAFKPHADAHMGNLDKILSSHMVTAGRLFVWHMKELKMQKANPAFWNGTFKLAFVSTTKASTATKKVKLADDSDAAHSQQMDVEHDDFEKTMNDD